MGIDVTRPLTVVLTIIPIVVFADIPALIELPTPDGPTPIVVFIGDTMTLTATAEGHPVEYRWWFYPPDDPGGRPPDAYGVEVQWTPDVDGQWLIQLQVRYAHEWPPGQLYRTNAFHRQVVLDPMPFHDGFETGDTSAWSLTIN